MQITIPKVKEGIFRCNFFSEMNKIEVAFEKKKRNSENLEKCMRVTKNVYIFHLHENFRLILRIWEKKWYEIILSFPKNAQMPHQIEYWKFQHILAQAVIKLYLSRALFRIFYQEYLEELDTKENTTNMISVRSISGLKWYCVQILDALRAANYIFEVGYLAKSFHQKFLGMRWTNTWMKMYIWKKK